MTKYLFLSISFWEILAPLALFAEHGNVPGDSIAYASMFASNFSMLLSIIIGFIATYLVFRAAKKMGGGLFGSVLNYINIGMVLILLGTASAVLGSWISDTWLSIVNTVCFAVGYIFMVLGANRLLKGIINV